MYVHYFLKYNHSYNNYHYWNNTNSSIQFINWNIFLAPKDHDDSSNDNHWRWKLSATSSYSAQAKDQTMAALHALRLIK